ncbi:hypothetical protein E4K72_03540 [Oxalobacteraceae bacterium OM1]|nr:hypothetical protein E4K72_03540 [Oxalobacteraceae bacterium OM1]
MGVFMSANTIGGRIIVKAGYERDAVFHAAAALLDTEQVRFVMTIADGHAWYLAAPAADFANDPDAVAPLAAALPGHPGHKGDAAYVFEVASGRVLVIVKQPESLKTFYGTEQQARRFVEMEGCTKTYGVETGGLPWQSFLAEQRREAAKLARSVVMLGAGIATVTAVVWLGAAVVAGRNRQAIEDLLAQHRQELSGSVAQLTATPVGNTALREHARLADEVMRYPNAQIKRFRFEDGRISWLVHVPGTAAIDRFKALGANVDPVGQDGGKIAIERKVN